MKKLEILHLANNNLQIIPLEIGNLKNLKHLNLKGNKLTKLPTTIVNLQNLEYLNLQGNNFTQDEVNTIKSYLPDITKARF